jgi:hypothetical protein
MHQQTTLNHMHSEQSIKTLQPVRTRSWIGFPSGETRHQSVSPVRWGSICIPVDTPAIVSIISQGIWISGPETSSHSLEMLKPAVPMAFVSYPAVTVLISLKNHRVVWCASIKAKS